MASLQGISLSRENREVSPGDSYSAWLQGSRFEDAKGGPSVAPLAVVKRGSSRRHIKHGTRLRPGGFLSLAYVPLLQLVGVVLVLVLISHYVGRYARCMRSLSASTSEGTGLTPSLPRRLATDTTTYEKVEVLDTEETQAALKDAQCRLPLEDLEAAEDDSLNWDGLRLELKRRDSEVKETGCCNSGAKRVIGIIKYTTLLLAILSVIGLAAAYTYSVTSDSPTNCVSRNCTTGINGTSDSAYTTASTNTSVSTEKVERHISEHVKRLMLLGGGVAAALSLIFAILQYVDWRCSSRRDKNKLGKGKFEASSLGLKPFSYFRRTNDGRKNS